MGWLLIGLLVGVTLAGYSRSESDHFLYIGPNKEKYDNAYIAILTKGK